jgi:hypothetical protein
MLSIPDLVSAEKLIPQEQKEMLSIDGLGKI